MNEPPDDDHPESGEEDAQLEEVLDAFIEDMRRDVSLAGIQGLPPVPGETVETSGLDAGDVALKQFIQQLVSRGPGHSRYVLHGEIAHGGMGVIHRVFDRDVRRTLAMKVILGRGESKPTGLPPDVDSRSLGRFLEEAQVTGQLDHPGIVPVHELGVDGGGQVYFTMKLVKGEDLRTVFDRVHDPGDDDWSRTRALSVLLRVCEAMAYAHNKGVIHRDLKPANVMVGKYGEVYVMDWGLARVSGQEDHKDVRLRPAPGPLSTSVRSERKDTFAAAPDSPLITMDGDVVGTPSYMPPEQAAGHLDEIGPHSDVYAVGAMLYHLLTGRMPYVDPKDRVSHHTLLAMVRQGPPRPIQEIRQDLPSELVAICDRAMTREVEDRYPTMVELGRDLRAFLETRVVAAYESGPIAELKKWVARNRGMTATAAAAVVVITALTTWYVQNIRTERNTARTSATLAKANEKTAVAQKDRADLNARKALDRKAEFDQLAGVVLLETALAKEKNLFPAWPEKADAMKQWLAEDALKLLELKPTLARTLTDLRERALPGSANGSQPVEALRFADESEQFLYTTLSDLAKKITVFESGAIAEVQQRLLWALRINELTRDHPNAIYSWEEAREAIAAADGVLASELYADQPIALVPQIGLVPIGMNPVTLLWEFYDLRTAHDPTSDLDTAEIAIPEHMDDGSLAIREETGLVLVLIPGGTYKIGAQPQDSAAPHHDPQAESDEAPVYEVVLEPYFISRYEMTQGQWLRMTGQRPSQYVPATYSTTWNAAGRSADLTHPVEQVSWNTFKLHLSRFGMHLPSEAQWEAACRARTETIWWTGGDRLQLDDAGNLSDQYGKTHGNEAWAEWEPDLDDGSTVHTRVGSYRANPFGLHDTIGNVWEWCLDDFTDYKQPGREGDGARVEHDTPTRVYRGGGFNGSAGYARSALRYDDTPNTRNDLIGCRPARKLSTD